MFRSWFVHEGVHIYRNLFVCIFIAFCLGEEQSCGRFEVERPTLKGGVLTVEGSTVNFTFSFINVNCKNIPEIKIEISKMNKFALDDNNKYVPQCTITHTLRRCGGSQSQQLKCDCLNSTYQFRYRFWKVISESDITVWKLSTPYVKSTPLIIHFQFAESPSTTLPTRDEDNTHSIIGYILGVFAGVIILTICVFGVCDRSKLACK